MKQRMQHTFFLFLVLAVAVPAFAQSNVGGGIKAGVNFATVSGIDEEGLTKSMRIGAAVGGFLSFRIADMVSFDPEVLYSMEGIKVKFTDSGSTFESTAKVNVVEIPLLLRLGMRSGGRASGYFLIGPAIGIIASAKQDDPFGGGEEDFKDELKSTVASVVVGAGVNISQFLVEARYSAGLTNLNKDEGDDKVKSRVFSILFGVRF